MESLGFCTLCFDFGEFLHFLTHWGQCAFRLRHSAAVETTRKRALAPAELRGRRRLLQGRHCAVQGLLVGASWVTVLPVRPWVVGNCKCDAVVLFQAECEGLVFAKQSFLRAPRLANISHTSGAEQTGRQITTLVRVGSGQNKCFARPSSWCHRGFETVRLTICWDGDG
ncbi:unnamed protein product [Polarella glacialis]|uniref:Uncharacterized protein n=1 Tax=Polarella glacialis TaxID=89957 RepID=A0A813HRV0_POLGL|nr:unnamed protein product [Polarella glacialis]